MTPHLLPAFVGTPELNRVYCTDALQLARCLPNQSVNCIVTSPPYFGLRDYGTGKWEGGDPDCSHTVGNQVSDNKAPGAIVSGVRPGVDASVCKVCGARRIDSQIGLEPTPAAYVAKLVELFRECRRALRDDGVMWVNIGDSYGTGTTASRKQGKRGLGDATQSAQDAVPRIGGEAKQLLGIPWRLAFALQDDGWILRADIIWAKGNPMPESVTDRPTKAHEYIFLFAKNPRYWYDADAIAEPTVNNQGGPFSQRYADAQPEHGGKSRYRKQDAVGKRTYTGFNERYFSSSEKHKNRNARSVWHINTKPYHAAHFATFPEELPRRCILAGCPVGGVVYDPFMGAGTSALVARRLGRQYIGSELNPAYIDLIHQRLANETLPLPLFQEATS